MSRASAAPAVRSATMRAMCSSRLAAAIRRHDGSLLLDGMMPSDELRAQLDAVFDDIEVDAVKIGMLGTAELMGAVAGWLEETRPAVVVLDPVMVASSGDALTAVGDDDGRAAWSRLLRAAHLVTPNLPELARLTGRDSTDWEAALDAARAHDALDHGAVVGEVDLEAEDLVEGQAGGPVEFGREPFEFLDLDTRPQPEGVDRAHGHVRRSRG